MQRIGAYLMEQQSTADDPLDLSEHGKAAVKAVENWLISKGASDLSLEAGTYVSVDNSNATFRRTSAVDGSRRWDLTELEEVTEAGRVFRTSVSVTVGTGRVAVLVTMEVGTTLGSITRVDFHPKCPSIVRDLLTLPGGWTHGSSKLQAETVKAHGDRAGAFVAEMIQTDDRAIPFVVVSSEAGAEAFPNLTGHLAYDLAGLANVISVDPDASWALTTILGKSHSVYSGGIRIYWPDFDESTDSPFRHQLWTASRLNSLPGDPENRFRRMLRELLMDASAISVARPKEIDEIRTAESRAAYAILAARSQELEQLKASASSLSDFEGLAEAYAADNDALRNQINQRDERVEQLEAELQEARDDLRRLRYQLQQVGAIRTSDAEIAPDTPEQEERTAAPSSGDVRFYKKTHSTPRYDVLEQVGGCNHSSWQSSHSADKAKKGLERLGLPEWKKLEHCGSCTGGGLWRVEW
ncbi:hypothetical protein [Propionibacterium freudenreichii]|uniref:hypothetical protein n=2 Tax=Propionibacterium freudenreichii TaxID=1744 RepID=UPI0038546187